MFSVRALHKFNARKKSARSFVQFADECIGESAENLKENRMFALSIVQFFLICHIVILGTLAFFYFPSERSAYITLVFATLTGAGVVLVLTLLNIGLFRDPHDVPVRTLGQANKLTLIRFALVVPVFVLIVHGRPLVALVVYAVSSVTDIFDGIAARRNREETQFGVMMDPLADILSTTAVFVALFVLALVPLWVILILMIRYVSLLIGSVVLFFVSGPIPFKATPTGKIVGVLQAAAGILIIGMSAAGVGWQDRFGGVLYAFLGMIFGSVIISQIIVGICFIRGRTTDAGS